MTKKVKRLFEQFQPRHYILEIKPDRETMKFSGSVIISGQKVGRPSQRVTLHNKNLKISGVHLIFHGKNGDEEINVDRINVQKVYDELRLHSKQMLYPGSYTIRLNFSGPITKQMSGIYPCFFKYRGQEQKLIATQFESHFAREVFPCIDEPEAKATFDLILHTPKGETVVSNTPIKLQTTEGKLQKIEFETTPKMSTYLLAFVYGKLGYKEAKTKKGVVVRTYATPQNVEHTSFALKTAVKCLDFYEEYFGVDFPLPKCDLIALPDFAVAGMENWGCITFSELALFVDNENTSLASKQLVGMVVAHELAHMWFGNLVTMRWWTDLWLNEGFASWVEYLALANIFPEWEMWTQFFGDEQHQAMKFDALEHTRAIEVPDISHPDEIRTAFDPPISYGKGSSVIHMLYHYLGEKDFQTGLRYYIQKHAYSNTETIDLWDALETASEKPVKDFMHTWISQPGFPLLHVTVEAQNVNMAQERFFVNPKHSKLPTQTWPIVLLSDHKKLPDILTDDSQIFKIDDANELKLNLGQSGFYRVAYNSTHLERLGELIRRGHLSTIDRLGLLSDIVDCAKAGYIDTLDVLHFLKNFSNEGNYAVWEVIASFIGSLRLVMDDEDLREDMKPFIRNLVALQLKRLGWTRKSGESHFDRLLRPTILGLASSADDPIVVAKCKKIFANIKHSEDIETDLRAIPSQRSVKRGGDVDPDLRGLIFSTVARLGGKSEFDKLLKLYYEATLSEEKVTIAAALTSFKQTGLTKQALELINSDAVRLQDVAYWISYSFLNRHGKAQTWEWLKTHWEWLKKNIGTDMSYYYMPIYSARAFSDLSFIKQYTAFFKPLLEPGLDTMYNRGIEMIEWQAAWKQRDLKEIKTFFKAQSQGP